eukprot:g22182.t1
MIIGIISDCEKGNSCRSNEQILEGLRVCLKMADPTQDLSTVDRRDILKLGVEAYSNGQWQQASDYFTEVLDFEPDHAVAMVNRASCYIRLNRYEEALKDVQRTLQRHPGYATAYLRLGQIFVALQRPEDAKQAFASALATDLSNETARQALNRVHMQQSLASLQAEAEKRYGTPFRAGEHFTDERALVTSPWKSPFRWSNNATPAKSPSRMPFTESNGPFLIQGFLLKKGTAGMQAWRLRWFELSPYALLWRLDDTYDPEQRERGLVPIMSIAKVSLSGTQITIDYGLDEKVLLLDTQTEDKAQLWTEAILKAKDATITRASVSSSPAEHFSRIAESFLKRDDGKAFAQSSGQEEGAIIAQTPNRATDNPSKVTGQASAKKTSAHARSRGKTPGRNKTPKSAVKVSMKGLLPNEAAATPDSVSRNDAASKENAAEDSNSNHEGADFDGVSRALRFALKESPQHPLSMDTPTRQRVMAGPQDSPASSQASPAAVRLHSPPVAGQAKSVSKLELNPFDE